MYPVNGKISSYYGNRILNGKNDFHYGIDFSVPVGTPVITTIGGTLSFQYGVERGLYAVLTNGNTKEYLQHLKNIKSVLKKTYNLGDVIGYSGNSGYSTGPHLHWGLNVNNEWVNPLNYIGGSWKIADTVIEKDEILISTVENVESKLNMYLIYFILFCLIIFSIYKIYIEGGIV